MTRNIKIPVFINGSRSYLKLRPGESRTWSQGGPTDEGWQYSAETYRLSADGEFLGRELFSDGCDCDGRLSSGCDQIAAAGRDSWTVNCYGEPTPDWQDADSWQRDQYAEAMGY